jgi:hypothetical protein
MARLFESYDTPFISTRAGAGNPDQVMPRCSNGGTCFIIGRSERSNEIQDGNGGGQKAKREEESREEVQPRPPPEIMPMSLKRRPWSESDCERLFSLVGSGASASRSAVALKRTVAGTKIKARQIGCPFPHEVEQRMRRRKLIAEL